MQAMLVTYRPSGQRVNIPLRSRSVLIGRGPQCGVRIPSGSVSRQHCELVIENDRLWAKDLGSANGTFVDGDRITLVRVLAGNVLTVGAVHFGIQVDDEPAEFPQIRPTAPVAGAAGKDDEAAGGPARPQTEGENALEAMISSILDEDEDDGDVDVPLELDLSESSRGQGLGAESANDEQTG